MKKLPLLMSHNLIETPSYDLPKGYRFRFFQHEDDVNHWAKIVTATDEFSNEQAALDRFRTEFATHLSEVQKRMFFVETADGKTIGTATGWFGTWNNQTLGRLHWVEISPAHQGKKLGKPMIAKAMEVLAHYHNKAYLKTQTTSLAAIHIYKKFGWEPVINTEQDQYAWSFVP